MNSNFSHYSIFSFTNLMIKFHSKLKNILTTFQINNIMKKSIFWFLIIFLHQTTIAQNIPPKYEMRAAWVATVKNIDWPTSYEITPGEQVKEIVNQFEALRDAGINAIFFQIRTECDALYNSNYEPWSNWLTGEQGKEPDPYYDPLEFAISEAHTRGMELHAWFNPYRAVRDTSDYIPSLNHVSVKHPEWILQFGKFKMLDPGQPAVREHILNVMTDVLTRYDIDGIHFDDYFYPYTPKISNEDSLTFAKYNRGFTDIDDWRRDNINLLMAEIYKIILAVKPKVKFGISPFGIVLNEYTGTDGFNSYDILYCDPLNWIENKTIDYINPQLYWEMDHKRAPYSKLQPWWAEVTKGRHLYIGLYSSKMASEKYKGLKSELGDQIRLNRNTENVRGSVFFSAKSITNNWSGLADSMKNDWYKYPALPPKMSWKDNIPPLAPQNLFLFSDSSGVYVNWEKPEAASDGEFPYYYLVYRFDEDEEINISDPRKIIQKVLNGETIYLDKEKLIDGGEYYYVVTSVDKLHNESKPEIQGIEIK